MYDTIIVGGGPAGLTAAIYASRSGLKSLVIESPVLSTQLITTDRIENYPGFPQGITGFELIDKFKKQAEELETEFSQDNVKVIQKKQAEKQCWQIIAENRTYECSTVIIASGARPKKLGIPGEEKLCGKGVSYCATCDGPLFKDKDIAVIGGGDAAIEEALFLTRFAKKVFIIHRRDRLRAVKFLQKKAFANKKMEIVWDSVIEEILGSQKVEAVKINNVKTDKKTELSCAGVFIFAGLLPNTNFIKATVQLDKNGYIATDENMQTSEQGIFACGDCRKKSLRQVVTACGDGAVAAFSVQQYVNDTQIYKTQSAL